VPVAGELRPHLGPVGQEHPCRLRLPAAKGDETGQVQQRVRVAWVARQGLATIGFGAGAVAAPLPRMAKLDPDGGAARIVPQGGGIGGDGGRPVTPVARGIGSAVARLVGLGWRSSPPRRASGAAAAGAVCCIVTGGTVQWHRHGALAAGLVSSGKRHKQAHRGWNRDRYSQPRVGVRRAS
jgi:hypothetical protein